VAGGDDAVGTKGIGEGIAQSAVVVLQLTDSAVGVLEPAKQGRIGCALAVGDVRDRWGTSSLAEPVNLGTKFAMCIQPGPRDACLFGDRLEADGDPGVVHVAQGGYGALLSVL
jgi:hypothetical protein